MEIKDIDVKGQFNECEVYISDTGMVCIQQWHGEEHPDIVILDPSIVSGVCELLKEAEGELTKIIEKINE